MQHFSTRKNTQSRRKNAIPSRQMSETGRIRFRGVRFQTPNSVSFLGLTEFRGSELSEFLSAYYLCAKANSPSLTQNSPSLPQNSVISLFRNRTLETVFRPFPKKCAFLRKQKAGSEGHIARNCRKLQESFRAQGEHEGHGTGLALLAQFDHRIGREKQ